MLRSPRQKQKRHRRTSWLQPLQTEVLDLSAKFPGAVLPDERENYSGWIVKKESLLEVATFLRDEMGYDLLSSVTGVDYLPEEKMEVVYQAYKTTGGPGIFFKVQIPRVDPMEVPSVINIWPGADFQEREIWDLYGIKFTGHPDLRRILTWEGFEGHPMRKDWQEAFLRRRDQALQEPLARGQACQRRREEPLQRQPEIPAKNSIPKSGLPPTPKRRFTLR